MQKQQNKPIDESFTNSTYAEQLLEAMSDEEADELAKLMGELDGAMEKLIHGQLRQQIEAAQSLLQENTIDKLAIPVRLRAAGPNSN